MGSYTRNNYINNKRNYVSILTYSVTLFNYTALSSFCVFARRVEQKSGHFWWAGRNWLGDAVRNLTRWLDWPGIDPNDSMAQSWPKWPSGTILTQCFTILTEMTQFHDLDPMARSWPKWPSGMILAQCFTILIQWYGLDPNDPVAWSWSRWPSGTILTQWHGLNPNYPVAWSWAKWPSGTVLTQMTQWHSLAPNKPVPRSWPNSTVLTQMNQ